MNKFNKENYEEFKGEAYRGKESQLLHFLTLSKGLSVTEKRRAG